MDLLIGLLTIVLFLNSLLLVLLILVQLPKKEAGAGLAFGGAASDALFGAGSGTALTKMTKYAAGIFLGLCLVLSVMRNHQVKAGSAGLAEALERQAASASAEAATAPATATNTLAVPPAAPNDTGTAPAVVTVTNVSVATATNPPPSDPEITAPGPAPTTTETNAPAETPQPEGEPPPQ